MRDRRQHHRPHAVVDDVSSPARAVDPGRAPRRLPSGITISLPTQPQLVQDDLSRSRSDTNDALRGPAKMPGEPRSTTHDLATSVSRTSGGGTLEVMIWSGRALRTLTSRKLTPSAWLFPTTERGLETAADKALQKAAAEIANPLKHPSYTRQMDPSMVKLAVTSSYSFVYTSPQDV